jgi:hypothetical protein
LVSAGAAALSFAGLAGRLLPKEPMVLLPLAVFLSPLPIVNYLLNGKNAGYF